MNSFADDFFSNSNIKSTSTKKKKKEYDVDNFTSSFFEDYDSSNDTKTESSYDNDFYDEYNAFVEIRTQIARNIKRLQKTATVVSTLDVLASFAQVAVIDA